jgi:arylsulfatase A-like enzyme
VKSLVLVIALASASPGLCQTNSPKQSAPRPNIILLMADDQGYGDVGFRGHRELKTPALDDLAKTAIRFERFYAAAPVCSPTRGSCLTGRHPYRYGIRGANTGHMKKAETTLAEILLGQGYRTGHFGKWHLGTLTKTEKDSNRGGKRGITHYAPPWEHGFERCFSTEAKVPTYDPMKTPPAWSGGTGNKKPGSPYGTAYWDESGQRITDNLSGDDSKIIMDRAIPFIESAVQTKQPFFTVIWFHAPHLPVFAGPKHLAPYASVQQQKHRHYYGCITALDEQVGRLRSRLRQLGVADNTMLWYCSDNGPEGRNNKSPGSNLGLRGRKRSLFDGGVRVPAFLEWPAQFKQPKTITAPCVTSDYLPTILAILKLSSEPRPLDGINLMPLLTGQTQKRGQGIGFQSRKQASWVEDRYKLVMQQKKVMLFDFATDEKESANIAETSPKITARLLQDLQAWRASCSQSATGADYK